MKRIERHGGGGGCDVQDRNGALELVMTCFVEEVTESDDPGGLAGKIDCQSGCAAGE